MAEDIDIEEHDVFDHPSLRNIFPDLSVLKKEIETFEDRRIGQITPYHESKTNFSTEMEITPYQESKTNFSTEMEITPYQESKTNFSTEMEITPYQESKTNFSTEMETTPYQESKTNFSTEMEVKVDIQDIKSEGSDAQLPDEIDEDIKPTQSDLNKIMLGSKPNNMDYEDFFKQHLDQQRSYNVDLILNDLGPYLQASGRFCKQCLILFPTSNCFDSHLIIYHSNQQKKSPMSKWKCVYRKRSNIIRKKNPNQRFKKPNVNAQSQRLIKRMISDFETGDKSENSTFNSKKCFHCAKLFLTQQSLIEHLYQLLHRKKKDSSKNISTSKKRVFAANKARSKSTKHDKSNTATIESSDYEEKSLVDETDTNEKTYYRCPICTSYQESIRHLLSHLHDIHHMYGINSKDYIDQKSHFNTICKYCASEYPTPRHYNNHLYIRHENFFFEQNLPRESEILDLQNQSIKTYKCGICGYNTTTLRGYSIHMNENHDYNVNEGELCVLKTYDSRCENCPPNKGRSFSSMKCLNDHIMTVHRDLYWKRQENLSTGHPIAQNVMSELKEVDNQDTVLDDDKRYYRCHVCPMYFEHISHIILHMTYHDILLTKKDLNEYEKTVFDPTCKYCSCRFSTIKSYNSHFTENHIDLILDRNAKMEISPNSDINSQNHDINSQNDDINSQNDDINSQNDDINSRNDDINSQNTSVKSFYRCCICFSFASSLALIKKHLSNHGCYNIPPKNDQKDLFEVSTFDPICKHCGRYKSNIRNLNLHINYCHKGIYFKNIVRSKLCVEENSNMRSSTKDIKQNTAISSPENTKSNPQKRKVKRDKLFRCRICFAFAISFDFIVSHLERNHGFLTIPSNNDDFYEVTAFDPKCKHCGILKNSQKKMNLHLNRSHNSIYFKNGRKIQQTNPGTKLSTNTMNVSRTAVSMIGFKCYICAYYLPSVVYYKRHLDAKHKINGITEFTNPEIFEEGHVDLNCKYCSKICSKPKSYNVHLKKIHWNFVNNSVSHTISEDRDIDKSHDRPQRNKYMIDDAIFMTPEQENENSNADAEMASIESEVELSNTRHRRKKYLIEDGISMPPEQGNENSYADIDMASVGEISNKRHQKKNIIDEATSLPPEQENEIDSIADFEMASIVNEVDKHKRHQIKVYMKSETVSECPDQANETNSKTQDKTSSIEIDVKEKDFINSIRPSSSELISKTDSGEELQACLQNTIFLLESAIFQCLKCDINFLSATTAKNHINHPEMLINWKCPWCKNIFKEEDRLLHKKQHMFCQNFTVHGLHPEDSSKVLFNCSKCNVHFDEDNFLKHYPKCEIETPNAVNCKVCDILIFGAISKIHWVSHVKEELKAIDFKIVYSDIIAVNRSQLNPRETKTSKADVMKKKEKRYRNQLNSFNLYLCYTCKCFTHGVRTKPHIKKACKNFPRRVCEQCGLTFSISSFVNHRLLHDKIKNLNLNHFTFYDYFNKSIVPPAPNFEECEKCHTRFFRAEHVTHSCNGIYRTCYECSANYDIEAFELDMSFHNYFKKNANGSDLNDIPHGTIELQKIKSATETKNDCLQHKETDFAQLLRKPRKCDVELEENVNKFENILYQCKDCLVTVDCYDKLIEHCQEHFSSDKINIKSKRCPACYLLIDLTCYDNHKALHEKHKENFFTVLNVDIFYFTSNNKVWTEHVFRELPPDEWQKIINDTIYKHECRIKMHLVQNGPSELTIYGCSKCLTCIDESNLFFHAQNSCFKMRKHECTYCHIPFNSAKARLLHENIHQTPGITYKSFKVISFNREKDKYVDELLYRRSQYFVQYLCRTCAVVVDKSQIGHHRCNRPNVKPCSTCGLRLDDEYYNSHCSRHKYIEKFTRGNIKLILFGDGNNNTSLLSKYVTQYPEAVFDYTLYCCAICKICSKTRKSVSTHVLRGCVDMSGKSKMQCSICKYYFFTAVSLNAHKNEHNKDLDFVRENMRVMKVFNNDQILDDQANFEPKQDEDFLKCTEDSISLEKKPMENPVKFTVIGKKEKVMNFSLNLIQTKSKTAECYTEEYLEKNVTQRENETSSKTMLTLKKSEIAESYKELNTTTTSTQKESQMAAFSEVETSKHLERESNVREFNEKGNLSTVDIRTSNTSTQSNNELNTVTMNIQKETKESCIKIYKCKCGLHFLDQSTVFIHSKGCNPKLRVPKHKCPKCHLIFTPKILFTHLLMHHGNRNRVYKFEIIDMTKDNIVVCVCLKCEHAELHVNKPERDYCPKCKHTLQPAIPLELYNQPKLKENLDLKVKDVEEVE